jgi:hypothetical protein
VRWTGRTGHANSVTPSQSAGGQSQIDSPKGGLYTGAPSSGDPLSGNSFSDGRYYQRDRWGRNSRGFLPRLITSPNPIAIMTTLPYPGPPGVGGAPDARTVVGAAFSSAAGHRPCPTRSAPNSWRVEQNCLGWRGGHMFQNETKWYGNIGTRELVDCGRSA